MRKQYVNKPTIEFVKKHRIIDREELVTAYKQSGDVKVPAKFSGARMIYIDTIPYLLRWNDYITFGKMIGESYSGDMLNVPWNNEYYSIYFEGDRNTR